MPICLSKRCYYVPSGYRCSGQCCMLSSTKSIMLLGAWDVVRHYSIKASCGGFYMKMHFFFYGIHYPQLSCQVPYFLIVVITNRGIINLVLLISGCVIPPEL